MCLRLALLCSSLATVHPLTLPGAPPASKPAYALHDAAQAGDASAVSLLLLSGLPPEERNAKESTALHLAALHGHDGVAEVLLDGGAAVNARNSDGMTPLHAAARAGHLEIAELLLARGAEAEAASNSGLRPIRLAAQQADATMIAALRGAGADMDADTAEAAFWAAVKVVDSMPEDEALPTEVPRLLREIFDADMRQLLARDKLARNLTCLQPAEEGGVDAVAAGMKYVFDQAEHANLPLKEGRRCEEGACCEACSRVTFPAFATAAETDLQVFPDLEGFNFNGCGKCSTATILNFVRLVERIRRSISHEYGLPLSRVLPVQAYARKYEAGLKQTGGGGSAGDSVILHTDEATHAVYHYSCVLYLSTQGHDFTGGSFVWNDPPADGGDGPRVLTPYAPVRGSAVIFSSGWENMHQVERLESGTRFAVPCFFTTEAVPEASLDHFGGVPSDDEAIADDLQHLLLDARRENPMQSAGRVKQLMMKWHHLLGGAAGAAAS